MNVDGYNREYNIARNKAVTGCFAMFALFLASHVCRFFEGSKDLMITGYLYPLLFGLEFLAIAPFIISISTNARVWGEEIFISAFLLYFSCVFC